MCIYWAIFKSVFAGHYRCKHTNVISIYQNHHPIVDFNSIQVKPNFRQHLLETFQPLESKNMGDNSEINQKVTKVDVSPCEKIPSPN